MSDVPYYEELVRAFVAGHGLCADGDLTDVVAIARAHDLALHPFKRKPGPARVPKAIGTLRGLGPVDLLDIGPGRGTFLWPFMDAMPWVPVTAVDRLPRRVEALDAVRRGGVDRLVPVLGDATDLPFGEGAFDVAAALEVLEHLERPEAAARELVRVTRRFVVVSVPSRPDDNPEHIQLFSRASLTALFEDAGARKVQVEMLAGHLVAVVTL